MRRSPGSRCASCWWWKQDRAYCQPCLSPVWDTSLAGHALAEAGVPTDAAVHWLRPMQITGCRRATGRCAARGCGRAAGRFSMPIRIIPMSMTPPWSACCCTATAIRPMPMRSTARGNGCIGMQSSDGGWGAFEPENTHHLPEPHSVCRSWRVARSADRGCQRALRVVPGADRHAGRTTR